MEYILKTIGYYIIIFVTYFILKNQYKRHKMEAKSKITWIQMIVIALAIGMYSVFCYAPDFVGDHAYYMHKFENHYDISSDSVGLNVVYNFLHMFTNDANILFLFTNSITTFLILVAYKKWEELTPNGLTILFMSEYFIYGFQVTKQVFANAFSLLALVSYYNKEKIKGGLFVILAILFHEVSYILLLVYPILLFSKRKGNVRLLYVLLIIVTVLYIPITTVGIKLINIHFPDLAEQLSLYITDDGVVITSNNIFTIFKGIPFYIITIVGIIKRKEFGTKINNYNYYLTLSIFVSLFIIMSFYMYWSFRFATLLYIPVLVFVEKLKSTLKGKTFLYEVFTNYFIVALGLKYVLQMFFVYGGL